MYELVLNELNSSSAFSPITDKIRICENLAISVGKRKRFIHESVVSIWNKFHDPAKLCALLDEKISKLTLEADKRQAEGKSLSRANNYERTPRYLDLATEFLLRSYPEEDLKIYQSQKPCPISKPVFEYCDKEFLLKFPQFFPSDSLQELKKFRHHHPMLSIKNLINNALLKQGPRDPSSSQTGDLPTPSCHGLGLLARAASDAEKCALFDVESPKDPRNLHQLLRAMDPRLESDDPDSVNDGRGASEYLCRSDGCDPGKDRSGSGERTRRSADAGPGRSDGARLRDQFVSATGAAAGAAVGAAAAAGAAGGGATASRRRNAPQFSVTASRRSAQTQAETESRRPPEQEVRRRRSRSRAAGADAGGVGVAQASGIGGELTFTPTVLEPSDRGTRRIAADWRQPPIF